MKFCLQCPHCNPGYTTTMTHVMMRRLMAGLSALAFLLTGIPGRADDSVPAAVDTAAAAPATTGVANGEPPRPSRAELAMFAMGLIGAVYRPGGDTPQKGMDCSGFVRYVYHEVAGLKLPHNAAAMSRISTVISRADLKPGDLVFFKTMKKAFTHVGIYLGDNQFIHASSSRTGVVMISSLDESYWAHRYDGARRVLSSIGSSAVPPAAAATMPAPDPAVPADPIAAFARP